MTGASMCSLIRTRIGAWSCSVKLDPDSNHDFVMSPTATVGCSITPILGFLLADFMPGFQSRA